MISLYVNSSAQYVPSILPEDEAAANDVWMDGLKFKKVCL